MRYTRLGESGLFVSRLSLGAMTFLKKDNEMAGVSERHWAQPG